MKKNIGPNTSALRKLALRKETIQQLSTEQLEYVGGGAGPTDGEPRSHYMSCTNTHCTSVAGSWIGC